MVRQFLQTGLLNILYVGAMALYTQRQSFDMGATEVAGSKGHSASSLEFTNLPVLCCTGTLCITPEMSLKRSHSVYGCLMSPL